MDVLLPGSMSLFAMRAAARRSRWGRTARRVRESGTIAVIVHIAAATRPRTLMGAPRRRGSVMSHEYSRIRSGLAAGVLATLLLVSAAAPVDAAVRSSNENDTGLARAGVLYEGVRTSVDPEAAFAALRASDKATMTEYLLPYATTTSVSLTADDADARSAAREGRVSATYSSEDEAMIATSAVGGCWTGRVKTTAHARAGNAIWDVWVEGAWCGGSTVSSAAFHRSWTTIAAAGWQDRGEIGSGAGVSDGTAKTWAQRRVVFGTAGWDLQTSQQCARIIGTAQGGIRGDLVCSTI